MTTATLTTLTKDEALSLVYRGHFTLPDGSRLRIQEVPDENTSISDFDCYGKVEWTQDDPSYGAVRPAHFDGTAEKLTNTWYSTLWWQPPVYTKSERRHWHQNPEYRREMRQMVHDITHYGFIDLRLEHCMGEDAYGRWIVIKVAQTGGLEPFLSDNDKAEVVMDMMYELF